MTTDLTATSTSVSNRCGIRLDAQPRCAGNMSMLAASRGRWCNPTQPSPNEPSRRAMMILQLLENVQSQAGGERNEDAFAVAGDPLSSLGGEGFDGSGVDGEGALGLKGFDLGLDLQDGGGA